ncbi:putative phospholipase B1, membrane-associated-like [Apostichopus japonicus]|uniref:Putative phospholipase B1, membrane-associated-like n=1 Tax=Stichopus japonicus TaxID=307972 RepID=A0A2G8JPR5_STIJA|nr:putative phospholipase B1, membrane-associated-like [Apostichopus japonicus]
MFKEGDDHQELVELIQSYQSKTEELVMSGRYDTRDDFTVVYQPFLTNTRFPLLPNLEGDSSYFAPDCFHFSAKGHATMAKELWKNMLQPVGQKSDSWNPPEDIKCPTKENPYIYTNMNSGIDVEKYPYYAETQGGATTIQISLLTIVLSTIVYVINRI